MTNVHRRTVAKPASTDRLAACAFPGCRAQGTWARPGEFPTCDAHHPPDAVKIRNIFGPRQLSALRIADPPKWERLVRNALRERTVAEAAAELGVRWRTLMRWRAELGITS